MYYEWNNVEEFNDWHNNLCQTLGYPLIGINQQTGLADETAQKTTSYVDPIILEDRVVAWLEEYTEGLVPSDYVPEKPN